jgi:hypothetical protein
MGKVAQNPRSLKSFGVAGLLQDNCKIYYDSLFCARHIGRVSDLLVAQLRLKGIISDDLRLRLVLLRSLYEAYCIQAKKEQKNTGNLKEPLMIECGVDSEKLAIGVSFLIEANRPFDLGKIKEVVETGTASDDPMMTLLRELFQDSDHLVLRANSGQGRIEVVSMLSLTPAEGPSTFEAVLLDVPEKTTSLSGEYIELGDLDYQTLLQNEAIAVDLKAPATGELLAQQGASELSEAVRLKGVAAAEQAAVKISGVTVDLGNDKQVVAGGEKNHNGSRELELYKQRTEELQNRIRVLEKAASSAPVPVQSLATAATGAPLTNAAPNGKGIVREIIEKVWPLKRAAKAEPAPVVTPPPVAPPAPSAAAPVVAAMPEAPKEIPAEAETEADTSAAGQEVRKLVNDEVGYIENTLKKVEQESQTLKKELAPKAQKWVEGMVGDLIGEKARLNDLGKKLSVSVRQKEVEFRNKEIKLQEEIRKRDEAIRQRTHAYNRAREQVNQLTSQLERAKAGVQTSGEELQSKQRYAMSQKLLSQAKEENQEQVKKIEELRAQVAAVQSESKEKKSTADYLALKAKFDKVVKQAEEFKRANQQLLEKLNEATRPKPAALNPEDLKRRLDVSMKLAASYQKDSEKLKLKIEDHVREENRLKSELAKTQAALRSSAKKPSGDSGADQAA